MSRRRRFVVEIVRTLTLEVLATDESDAMDEACERVECAQDFDAEGIRYEQDCYAEPVKKGGRAK